MSQPELAFSLDQTETALLEDPPAAVPVEVMMAGRGRLAVLVRGRLSGIGAALSGAESVAA
jgi:hypothetical protein